VKAVTFCVMCGATAPADAERCPSCDLPLKTERKRTRQPRRRITLPSPLTILVTLAVVAALVALFVYLAAG